MTDSGVLKKVIEIVEGSCFREGQNHPDDGDAFDAIIGLLIKEKRVPWTAEDVSRHSEEVLGL